MEFTTLERWRAALAALVIFPFLFSLGFVAVGLYSLRLPDGNPFAFLAPAFFFASVSLGWFAIAFRDPPTIGAMRRFVAFAIPSLALVTAALWIVVIIEVEPTLPSNGIRLPVTALVLALLVYASFTAREAIVGRRKRPFHRRQRDSREDEGWVPPMPPFG
jgi:hypothetical protein